MGSLQAVEVPIPVFDETTILTGRNAGSDFLRRVFNAAYDAAYPMFLASKPASARTVAFDSATQLSVDMPNTLLIHEVLPLSEKALWCARMDSGYDI